jgi:hypothetical protein
MLLSGIWYEISEIFKIGICDLIDGVFEHRPLPGQCHIFGPRIYVIQLSRVFSVLEYATHSGLLSVHDDSFEYIFYSGAEYVTHSTQ